MGIDNFNGGAVVAMTGEECFAIACDRRFGANLATITCDHEKVHRYGDRLFVGLGGLASDCQTVAEKLTYRKNLYEQKEHRQMSPKVFENMLSNMLYEHRFGPYYVSTIVAGLTTDKDGRTKPYRGITVN